MKDILEEIISRKQVLLEEQKKIVGMEQLVESAQENIPRLSMREALLSSPTGIIAEFKRKSPSKGWIKAQALAEEIVPAYERNGAAALSILTDEPFFGGSLKDIRTVRPLVDIPILRKDFIIDEYQLYQAKVVEANAVLLIAAALTPERCEELAACAHELGLETLLEIHSEKELAYVGENIDMVGVNNRNLGTFHTDVENSFRLISQLPKDTVLVSESGISSPDTMKRLHDAGFKGFLIGENFMKTDDPGKALKEFIAEFQR